MFFKFLKKYRIIISVSYVIALLFLFITSDAIWQENGLVDTILTCIGILMIGFSVFGRLWASVYISGYKQKKLITVGPYSLVRNPLYFFSFIGAIGVGCVSESLLMLSLIVVPFVCIYPFVIIAEERKLFIEFGALFREYMKTTPRFLPNFKKVSDPEHYEVSTRIYHRKIFEAMWFFWFYGILEVVEALHQSGVLPIILKIP